MNSAKLPEKPVLFIDRSLGRNVVADALRKAGARVEIHDDHFPQNAKDEVWLSEVGGRGWLVLTKDSRLRYHPLETEALLNAKVAAFILTAGGLTGQEMAEVFVKALLKIYRFAATHPKPFIARINKAGKIARVL